LAGPSKQRGIVAEILNNPNRLQGFQRLEIRSIVASAKRSHPVHTGGPQVIVPEL